MSTNFDNYSDVIYSRDVIERITELESEMESFMEENDIPDSERGNPDNAKWTEWEESSEAQELKALQKLAEQAEDSPDWKYGETLIRDSYFVEYTQELCEELGYMEREIKWPFTCIDWDKAARELQYDYFMVDFDGVDYWIRG